MNFAELQLRFMDLLREKVRNGELTERGLARMTGISQPHIHNALKGRRDLSRELTDTILCRLELDLLDLVRPDELLKWHQRP